MARRTSPLGLQRTDSGAGTWLAAGFVDVEAGVGFRSSERVRRRAMPVAGSILWRPLRDPHYFVAAMQPNNGRRQLFATQAVLARVQTLVLSRPAGTFGLLIGQRYECSDTGTGYLYIDRLVETVAPAHADTIAEGVPGLMSAFRGHDGF